MTSDLQITNTTITNTILIQYIKTSVNNSDSFLDLSECVFTGTFNTQFPFVSCLRMNYVDAIPSGFFSNFPNLKELSLMESNVDIFDSKLHELHLTRLSLCGANVKNESLILNLKSSLEYLDVCSCNLVGGTSIRDFIVCISKLNLKYMDARIAEFSPDLFMYLVFMKNLQVALVKNIFLTDQIIEQLYKSKILFFTQQLTVKNIVIESSKYIQIPKHISNHVIFYDDIENTKFSRLFNAF